MAEKATVAVRETFDVAASQERVWAALADVGLIAECMPNSTLEPGSEPGTYEGTIAVRLGPLKAQFRGTVTVVRANDRMQGEVVARAVDKLGSRVNAAMTYTLAERAGGESGTHVTIEGTIDVSGTLAKFAHTGGQVLARNVTRDFAGRLEEKLQALGAV